MTRDSIRADYDVHEAVTDVAVTLANQRHFEDFTTRLERIVTEPEESIRRAMADKLLGQALHWVNAAADHGLALALAVRRQEGNLSESASGVPQETTA